MKKSVTKVQRSKTQSKPEKKIKINTLNCYLLTNESFLVQS